MSFASLNQYFTLASTTNLNLQVLRKSNIALEQYRNTKNCLIKRSNGQSTGRCQIRQPVGGLAGNWWLDWITKFL